MKIIALIFLLALSMAAAGNIGWWGGPSYSYHSRPVVVRRYYSSPGWSGGHGWNSGWNSGWNGGWNGW